MLGKRTPELDQKKHQHHVDFFDSDAGPFIYDHGKLRQSVDHEPHETKKHHSEFVRMDDEHYEVSIVFDVATTHHNYARGNLYLQAVFNSYRQGHDKITVPRSGFLYPRGRLRLFIGELVQMVPLLPSLIP